MVGHHCVCVCVCVCVFGIIRCEGGRASCQLAVDGRNIIIMHLIIKYDLPHTMHSATFNMLYMCVYRDISLGMVSSAVFHAQTNVHMHVLMDPTKLTYLHLLQGIARLPPPPPPLMEG